MTPLLTNPIADRSGVYGEHPGINEAVFQVAWRAITGMRYYCPTNMSELGDLARRLGVSTILYKDESTRFGVGSFKALGASWGVGCAVARSKTLLVANRHTKAPSLAHVCCASDGNHGRAVAWAARTLGLPATVFVPDVCSSRRAAAIAAYGANVVRVDGTYEDALHRCVVDSELNGWILVSDTAYPGCDEIPMQIMCAYQVIAEEVRRSNDIYPTHIFVQAGSGGLAGALCAFYWERLGPRRPVLIVVEAEVAACLFESAIRGRTVRVDGPHPTSMAGLACGEASTAAWDILKTGADFFMTVSDDQAHAAVRRLSNGAYGKTFCVGDAGAAGVAAMESVGDANEYRDELGLTASSRVLLIGTEASLEQLETEAATALERERVSDPLPPYDCI
jgi:diaminopropionate ammonia-lyase